MSEKSRPTGFIISAELTTTTTVSGCSKLPATEVPSSRVVAPVTASRSVTIAQKNTNKPSSGRKLSLIQSSSKPGTAKASQVWTGENPVKMPIKTHLQRECSKNNLMPSEAPPSAYTASLNKPHRHINPSKQAFTTRRYAYKIVSRLGGKPAGEFTEQEKSSL